MLHDIFAWNFLDFINPLNHVSDAQYVAYWQMLFATLLYGFWPKLIASLALAFSLILGIWKQRVSLGIFLFVVSVVLTYFGGVVMYIFRIP